MPDGQANVEIHRALSLTNPLMEGPDVRELQDSINEVFGDFKLPGRVDTDGEFGRKTNRKCNRILFLLGVDPTGSGPAGPVFTQDEQRYIRNPDTRSREQKDRSKRRVEDARKHLDDNGGLEGIRAKIVQYALWGCANEPSIHYRQSRPYPSNTRVLPMYTDCSGFSAMAYKDAGGPDPNGLGFSGYGYTGTILNACDHISPHESKAGDLIVYGPSTGHHVVIAIEDGASPMTVSHGQEAGPFRISHASEDSYQPEPDTFCRILDD